MPPQVVSLDAFRRRGPAKDDLTGPARSPDSGTRDERPDAAPVRLPYAPLFPLGPDQTPWRKLDIDGVSHRHLRRQDRPADPAGGAERACVPGVPRRLPSAAAGHLRSFRAILDDPEASANDRFVALDLLKNANIAAGGVLPMCQDTGTAIVFGKKGQRVWVEGDEEEALAWGVHRTYTETNLRYSQMAPLSMFEEVNTGNNLPVQFDIMAAPGDDMPTSCT